VVDQLRKSAALSFILFFIFALSTGTTVSAQISNDITVCRGEVITITARLLQNITFGSPVPNQELEFYDETINQYISSAVTDSQGFASIDSLCSMSHFEEMNPSISPHPANMLLSASYLEQIWRYPL
jgi:hypothetical protein